MLLFAGFAGLVAGTRAVGFVEYSKLRAERDQQAGQPAAEHAQLKTAPDAAFPAVTRRDTEFLSETANPFSEVYLT